MKPVQVFLFIISVLSLLLILTLSFPKKGIKLYGDTKLEFITFNELINPEKQEFKNMDSLLALTTIEEDESDIKIDSIKIKENQKEKLDSVLTDSQYVYFKPKAIRIDSVTQFLEFPNHNREILYDFFERLASGETQRKIIRIMHYGDSQIEMDRMSSYFRRKLQSQFGGYGAGFVPAVQPYGFSLPMIQSYEGNWKRYTPYGRKDTSVTHRRYGVLGNFSRFSPINPDSSYSVFNPDIISKNQNYKASLTFELSPYSKKRSRQYKRCRMFYGFNRQPVKLRAFADEVQISSSELAPCTQVEYRTWEFEKTPKKIRFEFETKDSPDFYGFAFDGYTGIAVDNIPMRGADGLSFTRMDLAMLGKFYRILNSKLLILQFGGNAVPLNRDNYDYYRRGFSYQLRMLHKIAPDVTVIVIGLADVSQKEGDVYITNPAVPLIRDALKQAAFENNCAYWDMYKAMGGENSMPSWVFHDPPLAGKDFIHFTPQGANYIAQMFYSAFMYEYNRYLRIRKKE